MQPIIQLENVSFSYSQEASRALTDVSLCIEQGEFVGIIGPSGAGKSTLAAVLSGAIPHHYRGAFYGAARVEGRDTCEISLTNIARVVGAVAQDIDAQMVASVVEDEMLFGLENFGVPHDQIEGRIQRALATVGIEQLRDREIATLSGGQKQKVAIAAILALEPRVLVLDEPTAALDPVSSRMVFETLREVNRAAGVTVVVIEQMVALLSEFCERVIVMNKGSVALDGTPREVFAHAEDLRAIGVDSPRVTRVYNSMRAQNLLAADQAPFSLSRGQRQMVALASVVVIEPKLVLLDEPTSGLDYRECMTVMQTVRDMAERGCAVVMVCHDMEVVSDFADRLVVMANGRILERGRTAEVFANTGLMREASITPPQVVALSQALSHTVSPAFASITEVSQIVDTAKELIERG